MNVERIEPGQVWMFESRERRPDGQVVRNSVLVLAAASHVLQLLPIPSDQNEKFNADKKPYFLDPGLLKANYKYQYTLKDYEFEEVEDVLSVKAALAKKAAEAEKPIGMKEIEERLEALSATIAGLVKKEKPDDEILTLRDLKPGKFYTGSVTDKNYHVVGDCLFCGFRNVIDLYELTQDFKEVK